MKYPKSKAEEVAKILAEEFGSQFQTLSCFSEASKALFSEDNIIHRIACEESLSDKVTAKFHNFTFK